MAFKRKRFRKRRSTFKRKGRKLARVGTVKRMISRSEESKWHVLDTNLNSGYDGPTFMLVNGISRGADRNAHAGNIITLKSLELRVFAIANSTQKFNRLRFILLIDKQCNAVAPDLQQFFATSATLSTNSVNSPLNPNYWGKRYKLLMDRRATVGTEGGATDVPQERHWKFTINMKNLRTQYNDLNDATITGIAKNSVCFFAITDEAIASQPAVRATAVLKWKDA